MQTTTGTDDFISGDIMEDNRGELFVSLNQNDLLKKLKYTLLRIQLMGLIYL